MPFASCAALQSQCPSQEESRAAVSASLGHRPAAWTQELGSRGVKEE